MIGQRMAVVKKWPLLDYICPLVDHRTIVCIVGEENGGGSFVHVTFLIPLEVQLDQRE